MESVPELRDVKAYLGGSTSWSDKEMESALMAEQGAQSRVCNVPVPTPEDQWPDWPDDLREALLRRVAVNLANRGLPLGVQASMSEGFVATSRVGGTDREVQRLEGPHRRRVPA